MYVKLMWKFSGGFYHLKVVAVVRDCGIDKIRGVISLEVTQSTVSDDEIGSDGEGRLLETWFAKSPVALQLTPVAWSIGSIAVIKHTCTIALTVSLQKSRIRKPGPFICEDSWRVYLQNSLSLFPVTRRGSTFLQDLESAEEAPAFSWALVLQQGRWESAVAARAVSQVDRSLHQNEAPLPDHEMYPALSRCY